MTITIVRASCLPVANSSSSQRTHTTTAARLGIPYKLTIYTGNKRSAGTDARVYAIMHHERESSGQIFLTDGKFETGNVDICTVDAPDNFSPLTALDIGHDNSGRAPGWFLDKVRRIRPPIQPKQ